MAFANAFSTYQQLTEAEKNYLNEHPADTFGLRRARNEAYAETIRKAPQMKLFCGFLTVLLLTACAPDAKLEAAVSQARLLGQDPFSVEAWASSDQEARGRMIASFLRNLDRVGLTGRDIVNMLGESTGYYDYDHYPAYLVGPRTVRTKYGEGYLLVFVTDHSTGLVTDVIFVPEVRPADNRAR